MNTFDLNKAGIIQAYTEGTSQQKKVLITLFGNEIIGNIIHRVKTVDDAFSIKGISRDSIILVSDTPDEIAYKEMKVVCEVLNEGWKPNFDNGNEKKWEPYFNMAGGFAFVGSFCVCSGAGTFLGSRLCYFSKEISDYAGVQFLSEYRKLLKL